MNGMATAALVGVLSLGSSAGAAELHFAVQEVGEKRALWVPQEVVLHRSTELVDGLVFVLKNLTDRTHAFAAYGLFEEVTTAGGGVARKPLRVNVTSEDTVLVQISTTQFLGSTDGEVGEFPFFCPLHQGDAHVGGTIRVIPQPELSMSASAAIADSLLRAPVSPRDSALSRRTVMNNAG